MEEWSELIFKSIDEFVLFTSGYYDLEKNPPDEAKLDYAKEEWIVELTSLQSAFVSSIVALTPERFRIPALLVEYFVNNRLHAEMITKLRIKKDGALTPKDFLICLSATRTTSLEDLHTRENLDVFMEKIKSLASRGILKTYSQNLFDIVTAKALASIPLVDSILSGVFSYMETKNIAQNTIDFLDGKHNTVYLAEQTE
jgi:hypothetical protein